MKYDTIIIGGGVSALGAAIYCGRFQLKTLIIGEKLGGTIVLTDSVSNYPGFKKIRGMDLFDNLQEHAKSYNIEILQKKVTQVEKCEGFFKVSTDEKTYSAHTIIFATGTDWRKLNVPGEKEFTNKGVHYCALCEGALYKNKVIAVAGGSDSAAKEALLLSEYGKQVYIIYRQEKIRAEPINLKRVEQNKKIEIITSTNIVEIKGDKFVNSIVFDKPYKGSKELKIDAIFVEIGHIPISDLAKQIGVKTNEKGEIIVDKDAKTNIKGIFAAGDVVNSRFKQVITGVAEGVIAAYNVYQFITKELPVCGCSEDK